MPKTKAERKIVSGWSTVPEPTDVERLTAMFQQGTDVLVELGRALRDTRKSFVAYSRENGCDGTCQA